MSYEDDPNLNRLNRPIDYERRTDRTTGSSGFGRSNMTGWLLGALAVLIVAASLIFGFNNHRGDQSAGNNTNQPAASAPATTGSATTGAGAGSTTPAPANR